MIELFYCGLEIGYHDIYHKEISTYQQVLNKETGKLPFLGTLCGIQTQTLPLKVEFEARYGLGETQYDGHLMNGEPYQARSKGHYSEYVVTPTLKLAAGFDVRYRIATEKWERDLIYYNEIYSTRKTAVGLSWQGSYKNDYQIDMFIGQGQAKTNLVVDVFNFNSTLKSGDDFNIAELKLGYKKTWIHIQHESWGTSRTKQGVMAAPETNSRRTNVSLIKHWFF